MQRVNLSRFYHFGRSMQQLKELEFDRATPDFRVALGFGEFGLLGFLKHSVDMNFPLSRVQAQRLLDFVQKQLPQDAVDFGFFSALKRELEVFETLFSREASRLSLFSITPKGIYDIEKLIDEGEKKFPPELVAVMPPEVIEDVKESGRCLAFERGTACAFHICRATEGLMRAYYKKLTGKDWPPPKMNRDWYTLVNQLKVERAPKKIIERLGELREDRNSYAHPDVTVPPDEASIVYETCTFAMFYIAKEMV